MSILLPSKLKQKLPSIETVLQVHVDQRDVYIHYFNPIGSGDWFVMGGDKTSSGWLLYGAIYFSQVRYDYFYLKELKNKRLPFDCKIQINKNFETVLWGELSKTLKGF